MVKLWTIKCCISFIKNRILKCQLRSKCRKYIWHYCYRCTFRSQHTSQLLFMINMKCCTIMMSTIPLPALSRNGSLNEYVRTQWRHLNWKESDISRRRRAWNLTCDYYGSVIIPYRNIMGDGIEYNCRANALVISFMLRHNSAIFYDEHEHLSNVDIIIIRS